MAQIKKLSESEELIVLELFLKDPGMILLSLTLGVPVLMLFANEGVGWYFP